MDLNSPWKLEFALLCPSVLPLSLSRSLGPLLGTPSNQLTTPE